MAEGFGLGLFCILPVMALNLAGFVFWIWMLIECLSKEPSEGNDKLIWILVIVLLYFIGGCFVFLRATA